MEATRKGGDLTALLKEEDICKNHGDIVEHRRRGVETRLRWDGKRIRDMMKRG